MNDVVVGVDRSETAHRAAVKAAAMAKAFGANLHIITSAEPTPDMDVGIGSDRVHVDWVSEAEQFLVGLSQTLDHDKITTSVTSGDPASALCDEAKRVSASVIVVGNRRVQGVSRILGSVASDVLKKAHCDVLVANTRE